MRDPEAFQREGILPKAIMAPRLKRQLSELAVGMKREGEYPNWGSVAAKQNINDEGPHAYLFRAVAIHAPGCQGNFHDAPELVEDLSGELLGANYRQLVSKFREMTIPCVVAFIAEIDEWRFRKALLFSYLIEGGEDEFDAAEHATTCYDSLGEPVTPRDIVAVEVLHQAEYGSYFVGTLRAVSNETS